jgi:hypothetical protein
MRYLSRVSPGLVAVIPKGGGSASLAFILAYLFAFGADLLLRHRAWFPWNVPAALLCAWLSWRFVRSGCRLARQWWRTWRGFGRELN